MQGIGQRFHRFIGCTDFSAEKFLASGPEILLEIQRIKGDCFHLAHRKGILLTVDRHTQQASRSRNMELRCFLTEVFQRGQCTLAGLDLIENDQCFTGNNALTGGRLQIPQEAFRCDIVVEIGGNRQIRLQIDIDHIFELLLAKFAEDIGLSHLAGAIDDQRQAVSGFILPS